MMSFIILRMCFNTIQMILLLCIILPISFLFGYITIILIYLCIFPFQLANNIKEMIETYRRKSNDRWSSQSSSPSSKILWSTYMEMYVLDRLHRLCHLIALTCSIIMVLYCRLFFGYEIEGLEQIPHDGPSLLIFYHGVIPLDMILMTFIIYIRDGRVAHTVAEKSFGGLPLLNRVSSRFIFPGPFERCVQVLNEQNLLQISPGGMREALFATVEHYETIWNQRKGFATVARTAKVRLVPIFTRNIRHLCWLPTTFQQYFRTLYERTNLPIGLFLGTFPVKLTTYIGKPIEWNCVQSAEELAEHVRIVIESMIEQYQTLPMSINDAIMERFMLNVQTKLIKN